MGIGPTPADSVLRLARGTSSGVQAIYGVRVCLVFVKRLEWGVGFHCQAGRRHLYLATSLIGFGVFISGSDVTLLQNWQVSIGDGQCKYSYRCAE